MVSQNSNRNNPDLVSYFQDLADIISIFWQFHKERIEAGNIDFAYVTDFETRELVPFDPDRSIRRGRARPHSIITEFSAAAIEAMSGSWQQFLKGVDMDHIEFILEGIPVPPVQERFFAPYSKELAYRLNRKTAQNARFHTNEEERTLGSVIEAGISTGVPVTVQLHALSGELFNPLAPVLLSKVRQEEVLTISREIGLLRTIEERALDYSLIDDSSIGLRTDRLRELGMGDTLGCPASMRVSSGTRAFLLGNGVNLGRRTMLEDFASFVPGQFKRYVGDWYAGLTPTEKEIYVDPEQRLILNGETRTRAIAEYHSRPHGKER